jgi:tetratricopeptide (TPR) repeat protein
MIFSVTCRDKVIAVLSAMLFAGLSCMAQSKAGAAVSPSAAAERAIDLARAGHCAEAIPEIRRIIRNLKDRDLEKVAGLSGLRCAMIRNQPYEAEDFLQVLRRDFPQDPDVLYEATHAYSDLSTRASQDLARQAPFSYQVHELGAETLENQGKWDEAVAEYRKILEINHSLPGIHYRLGRALLSEPAQTPEVLQEAKRNFELELKIDPANAGAEGVLGQLAVRAGDAADAIDHFKRATKLDTGFAEGYILLGSSLVSEKRYEEAVSALETGVKLDPDNPEAHYNLAVALSHTGRKEDADREFAIHRKMQEANPPAAAPN